MKTILLSTTKIYYKSLQNVQSRLTSVTVRYIVHDCTVHYITHHSRSTSHLLKSFRSFWLTAYDWTWLAACVQILHALIFGQGHLLSNYKTFRNKMHKTNRLHSEIREHQQGRNCVALKNYIRSIIILKDSSAAAVHGKYWKGKYCIHPVAPSNRNTDRINGILLRE